MDAEQRQRRADTMSPEEVLSLMDEVDSLRKNRNRFRDRLYASQRKVEGLIKDSKSLKRVITDRNARIAEFDRLDFTYLGPMSKEKIRFIEKYSSTFRAYFLNSLIQSNEKEMYVEAKAFLEPNDPKAAEKALTWWERELS